MTPDESSDDDRLFMQRTVEAAIRIGAIAALIIWCFLIARPFLVPMLWGAIIAIAVFHGYTRLVTGLGGRRVTAAVLVTLLMLVLLVVPSVLLGESLVSGARYLVDSFQSGELHIPPPPDSIAGWPLIGEPIAKAWTLASGNLEEALRQVGPLFKGFGLWLVSAAAGAGLALLQFVLAILISGAFLANSEAAGRLTRAVAKRLAGERGLEFARIAEQTVRSVASGILGVALIQALLAGLGFLVAGVPAAGLLTLVCVVFGVIQLGVVIVLIPVVIYLFSTADIVTAVGFLVWALLVAPIDNILKPLLLGRGVDVPMLVIFVGAIGGFLSAGIIGLFLGAVVLALGYKLFLAWLAQDSIPNDLESGEHAPRV
ncbi:MAG TPA: AI-2E family transporter [Terriglobales bacterium]|nr:AI-2E family transporter [Terriglobales bacterium]